MITSQRVVVSGSMCMWELVKSSVSQRSVVGPVLVNMCRRFTGWSGPVPWLVGQRDFFSKSVPPEKGNRGPPPQKKRIIKKQRQRSEKKQINLLNIVSECTITHYNTISFNIIVNKIKYNWEKDCPRAKDLTIIRKPCVYSGAAARRSESEHDETRRKGDNLQALYLFPWAGIDNNTWTVFWGM